MGEGMTKGEIRMTKEIRSPNDEAQGSGRPQAGRGRDGSFGFRHSGFFHHSSFGIRHWAESRIIWNPRR
jgi:hypothetical protein